LLASSTAYAELSAFDAMVMPGEVIKGHQKYESQCSKCHVLFKKSAQIKACLDCHDHKNIARDIDNHKGYHGRIKIKDCKQCHTEHKGRNAKIAVINDKVFDHKLTDFKLRGKHRDESKVKCKDCHKKGKKYWQAPKKCYSCHKKDDEHKGKLGKKCERCHTEKDWKKTRFDHDKTKFKLRGGHRTVKCEKCHKNKDFKKTPRTCYACHRKDDDHKGKFGKKCKTCHTDIDWKRIKFKHNRDTKFKLRGAHKRAKCTTCHKGYIYKEKLKKTCYGCHKKDDDHKGNFGTKCKKCHTEIKWEKVKFNHNRHTKYKLRGAHKKVKCNDCHKRNAYKHKTSTKCYACHKKDDKHKGSVGKKCEKCHNVVSWEKVLLDHDLTRFPLLGKHKKVKCKKCHKTKKYRDASLECNDCHEKEDEHKGRFGTKCDICHNASSWKKWRFNHDKQTNFILDGEHKGLECEACHTRAVSGRAQLEGTCISCHQEDDVHDGGFGLYCERCHYTTDFIRVKSRPGIILR
jgi:hypothetical protein